jgi:hypothetical protein
VSLKFQFARDWFFERLQLVAEDILTSDEREERSRRRIYNTHVDPLSVDEESANHLRGVLSRGIQVI